MRSRISLFAVILLFAFQLSAQTNLSGLVTDTLDIPLPYAHVFLSKTTIGTMANSEGEFVLSVPQDGNYELVITCVGYSTGTRIINVNGSDQRISIKLNPRIFVLDEVVVNSKGRNRRKNFHLFKEAFIGKTSNSQYCHIENAKDLVVFQSSGDSVVKAFSRKPLLIKNASLGYTIFFVLQDFQLNLRTGHLRYSGNYYFEEIKAGKIRNDRWQLARLKTYFGSKMHFLRAVFNDSLKHENFETCAYELDSCRTDWVLANAVEEFDLYKGFDNGTVSLFYNTPVSITYTFNHPELSPSYELNYRPFNLSSVIIFSDLLQVYRNGYYSPPYAASWGGDMARERVADMLPYDFVPVLPVKKKK
jgi:hypothetical protein